jgi:acyl-CoA synthetase (NDP forming)
MLLTIPEILLEDRQIDGILMYFLFMAENFERLLDKAESPMFASLAEFEDFVMNLCRRLADAIAIHEKPLLGSSFIMRSEKFIRELEDLGIPILPSPERSARAMGALYRYNNMREALLGRNASDGP